MLDGQRITMALIAAKSTPDQTRMAMVLWKANGVDSALSFIDGVKDGRAGPTANDGRCSKCGGTMIHSRLKGYQCPTC